MVGGGVIITFFDRKYHKYLVHKKIKCNFAPTF